MTTAADPNPTFAARDALFDMPAGWSRCLAAGHRWPAEDEDEEANGNSPRPYEGGSAVWL